MYRLLRPLLFCMDEEKAHALVLSGMQVLPHWCFPKVQGTIVHAMGLRFPHPLGLAAGFDKNGTAVDGLAKLGFSFLELGTVTPNAQLGNPKPRLFRLPEALAIINRMGFNNDGVDALVERLKKMQYQGILGINIGKNKDTPIHRASEDYLYCLRKVYPYASYITVNISSPNTQDLRLLQQDSYCDDLLKALSETRQALSDEYQKRVPLVLKISPDEDEETIKNMTRHIVRYGIDGVIATNTTNNREDLHEIPHSEEEGGLSGRPLLARATHCLRLLKRELGSSVCLIGVGGIDNPRAAQEKLDAGASLLQIYTGLIYQGPKLIPSIVEFIGKDSC